MSGIEDVGRMTNDFQLNNKAAISSVLSRSKKLRESCSRVESSWSGSYVGWHSRMYYHDFAVPAYYERFSPEWGNINGLPDGWEEKQTEDVKTRIESLVGDGFSIDSYESDIENLHSEAEKLKDEVLIAMSTVSDTSLANSEQKLQAEIESLSLGNGRQFYIQQRKPGHISTRDSEALSQGIRLPAWLYYDAIALEASSLCESIDSFIRLTKRVARQILARGEKKMETADLHADILEKCSALYSNQHYPEAVGKSFLVVRDRLRQLTGYETGSDAFGKGNLHIKGASADNVDEDFNAGVKFLTMAIDRFRNEKFHTSDANISDPVRAYQYLALSSLAMSFLDNAEILKPKPGSDSKGRQAE